MKRPKKHAGGRQRSDETERPAPEIAQIVGARIAARRRELDIGLHEAAARATRKAGRKISHVTISRIETGKQSVTVHTLVPIASALGTTASDLLKGLC